MNFAEPTVSVIIPSYNHGDYVATAISSVLTQTFSDFELVIIDDASTDNSQAVIASFTDPRIRFYPMEKNSGAVPTLNRLFTLAKGNYIALLNSDDFWEQDKLQKQVAFLEEHPDYGMVFSSARLVTESSEPGHIVEIPETLFDQKNLTQGGWLKKLFLQLNFLCHPSMMIRRALYDFNHAYNYAMRQCPDLEMHIHHLKKANLYVLPERLVNLRIMGDHSNASAVTYANLVRSETEVMFMLDGFFDDMPDSVFLEGFSELCMLKTSETHAQIRCEQALLYFKVTNGFSRAYELIGLRKLFSLLNEGETREILERDFGFTFNDFFSLVETKGLKDLANTWLAGIESSVAAVPNADVRDAAPIYLAQDSENIIAGINIRHYLFIKIKQALKKYPCLYRKLKKLLKRNAV